MSMFYESVNDWFTSVIRNAPPQLRNGFFLSHLGFYDVQNSLLHDTLSSIGKDWFLMLQILKKMHTGSP